MIRDLVSNNVLSLAVDPQTINNTAATSASIDLSDGTTGNIQLALDSAGAASVSLVLEYSDDGISWVVDDGTTGNGFVDADCVAVASPVVAFPALVFASVVNPRGTAQYARVIMTETASVACIVCAIGAVGPRRLLVPTDS